MNNENENENIKFGNEFEVNGFILKAVMRRLKENDSVADKLNKLNFYSTSFACLCFYMNMFDEDIMQSKRNKTFNMHRMFKKYVSLYLADRVRDILRIHLASKMINVDIEILMDSEIIFEDKDEESINEDVKIICDVFIDYVVFRLEERDEIE